MHQFYTFSGLEYKSCDELWKLKQKPCENLKSHNLIMIKVKGILTINFTMTLVFDIALLIHY